MIKIYSKAIEQEGYITKSTLISVFCSLVLLANILGSCSQNLGTPSPTSNSSSGISDSPWPMFHQNLNHTGLSPYDTSANNGQLKWSLTTGGNVESPPTIGSDGTIYVGSWDNRLYAIKPNGIVKWIFMTGGEIACAPAISNNGTIYVGSCDDNLYAINPDGTEKWRFTTGSSIEHTSPAIGQDGTIYVGSDDNNLYAINPDGTEKWRFMTGSNIYSSPAIGCDGTIYVGSSDYKLYAINPSGNEKWNFTRGYSMPSSPAIACDGTIYVGSYGDKLYAISPYGFKKWSFTTGFRVWSSPAIGSDGTIYVGSWDNKLYAINSDGSRKWSFTTGDRVHSSPAIGSDGTIYVGSHDNKMYALNPDGTEKWNFTTGGFVRSSPAIGSDGTIYFGSYDNKLYAIGTTDIPPIANAGPDRVVDEGDDVQFNGLSSYDPDGTITTYEWDFDSGDGLWWETGTVPEAIGSTPPHIYGDDGIYTVTLRVTDNGNLSATDTCNVTVQNVDPIVTIESVSMEVEIGLRVAGRKYNDVGMTLYEDDNPIGYVSIERMPGSPDEQMAWIPISVDFTISYSATVTYTLEDPPNIGANPVWIYLKSENGSIKKIHHTFNVQQSKKRDSEHWNHMEPWEVDLSAHLIGLSFEVVSHVTDPGSDDEYLTYSYGSQIVNVTYLNDPPNLDTYPSPELNPVEFYDTIILVYEGPETVYLDVIDDDGGTVTDSFLL